MADPLPQPFTFGDTSGDLGDHTQAGAQTLSDTGTVVGDANTLLDHAVGGNDTLSGFATSFGGGTSGFPDPHSSVVIGDAITITDHAQGGDDLISGLEPLAYGDAITLSGHAHGGNDSVSSTFTAPTAGGAGTVFGDADTITDHAKGGNDTVFSLFRGFGDAATISGFGQGGDDHVTVENQLAFGYGDAFTITDNGRGGDDVVTLAAGSGTIFGDANTLSGNAVGGNDTLIAQQDTPSKMYGDGLELLDHAKGGNDTLISGPGNDQMWGDAATVAPTAQTGADIFDFSLVKIGGASPAIGHDTIEDFQPGKDHIEIQGFENVTSFADVQSHTTDTPQGAMIAIDANDSILLANDHNLTASDFFFT